MDLGFFCLQGACSACDAAAVVGVAAAAVALVAAGFLVLSLAWPRLALLCSCCCSMLWRRLFHGLIANRQKVQGGLPLPPMGHVGDAIDQGSIPARRLEVLDRSLQLPGVRRQQSHKVQPWRLLLVVQPPKRRCPRFECRRPTVAEG